MSSVALLAKDGQDQLKLSKMEALPIDTLEDRSSVRHGLSTGQFTLVLKGVQGLYSVGLWELRPEYGELVAIEFGA